MKKLILLSLLVPISSYAITTTTTVGGGGGGGYGGGGHGQYEQERLRAQARQRQIQAMRAAQAAARAEELRLAEEAKVRRAAEKVAAREEAVRQRAANIQRVREETPRQIVRNQRVLEEEHQRNNQERIERTNQFPLVREANRTLERVNAEVYEANRKLNNTNRVQDHLDRNTTRYIRDQIQSSTKMAEDGVEFAREGNSPQMVRLVEDFALDTINSVNAFLGGVAGGVYGEFVNAAQAMEAIYNNPALIGNIENNMMRMFTDEHVIENGIEFVTNALKEYNQLIWYGDAGQIGNELGHLGAQMAMGAMGAEFLPKGALGPFSNPRSRPSHVLGERLQQAIERSPELRPAVDATHRMIENAREAVMRNLDQCRNVRDMYNEGMPRIRQAQDQMRIEGRTPEAIARRVHQMRRELGRQMKEITPQEVQPFIQQRNMELHNDPLGPTIEQMRNAGKSWEQIAETASTANQKVNDFLGGL